MPRKNASHCGFTLAEVLITLTIVGVIAALTIPNLMNKYQEHTFKVAWKKNFQTLSQIAGKANADGVQLFKSYKELGDGYKSTAYLRDNLMNYYKNAKAGCYFKYAHFCDKSFYQWYNKDGTGGDWNTYIQTGMKLEDGTAMGFDPYGDILFDVNGANHKPNIVGKDIFAAIVCQDNRVYPFGSIEITKNSNCTAFATYAYYNITDAKQDCENGKGYGCSALYLLEE